jgi:glycerate kinase
MKVLIIPDKFKGSLSAIDVCDAIEKGIHNFDPTILTTKIPLADGGEGSLTVLEDTLKFERIYLEVNDPLFRKIKIFYGLFNDTAYIEMASASGLQLLTKDEQNPMRTTSYGTGEIILDAINKGAKKIILFIGGSSTNDAGIGLAVALGYKFYDKQNIELEPIGKNLSKVKFIDKTEVIDLSNIQIEVLSDVNNTLYGKTGAAFIYAKQKGANKEEIDELNNGLNNIAEVINLTFNIDISNIPGSGAAGGVGGGSIVFLNAKIKSGTNAILEMLDVESKIKQSDIVITGEGKFDQQTLEGKLVKGIMDICNKNIKPLGIICGVSTLTQTEIKSNNIVVKQIKTNLISEKDSIENAEVYIAKRAEEVISDYVKYFR